MRPPFYRHACLLPAAQNKVVASRRLLSYMPAKREASRTSQKASSILRKETATGHGPA